MRTLSQVSCLICLLLAAPTLRAASDIADAAMRRDTAALRSLITQSRDVSAPQVDGTTALHWVSRWNDLDSARVLVAAGANARAANRYGATPLHLASVNGSAPMIELLLNAGADVNDGLPGGETVLMTAANSGSLEAVKSLIARGANVNARESVRGQTALMWAAAENHSEIVRLLLARGADVHACTNIDLENPARGGVVGGPGVPTLQCSHGGKPQPRQPASNGRIPGPPLGASGGGAMTPFLFAVRQGAEESARILIDAGADVNETMADGTSALVVAIINGHYDLASHLLELGADPNVTDIRGRAALYQAAEMRNYRWSEFPKPVGDVLDPLALIQRLLEHGADPNARISQDIPYRGPSNFSNIFQTMVGATPFMRAAESGDTVLMHLLLGYGADPRVKLRDNTSALMLASGIGFSDGSTFEWSETETLKAVRLFIELGFDVNESNSAGLTALHGAAHRGSNALVQLLAANGARLDTRDGRGRTPLTWAEGVVVIAQRPARPQPQTVALLKQLMNVPAAVR